MKTQTEYGIETYISDGGYYVIKQCSLDNYMEENTVLLSPAQMQLLIEDLSNSIDDLINYRIELANTIEQEE